jgi:hypothetical protein
MENAMGKFDTSHLYVIVTDNTSIDPLLHIRAIMDTLKSHLN